MDKNLIRQRAASKDISLKELSEAVGYTRTGFYSAVTNETIALRSYVQMCKILGVPFGTYIDDTPKVDFTSNIQQLKATVDRLSREIDRIEKPQ